MKLNEKIIYCRKKAGYSQEALAEKLSVSRQAVSKWETGESQPELSKLAALATLFGVTADWLISEEEPEPSAQNVQLASATSSNWVESVPGVLGKLIRKYGWIFGVYLAVGGALMAIIGAIARWVAIGMQNSSTDIFEGMLDSFNGMTGNSPFDTSIGSSFTDGMQNAISQATTVNPVAIIGTVIIVIGSVFCVGGIILAIVLRKQSKKEN
jgi:transcriptional regulator with XRE-family HTH domain